ncbi:uncharacterized protein LOC107416538 isoform X2 [Ziziphus jujuba]|uniref:Uncharacterized protein LOC107416538 isoform X2 n=1 Tax=Ziziphus jujuba TaxID=326968 RepID=A0ABM3IHJ3_ZIZJJ|nr:uncharacterized protein LOC107416538 isoform X2 [Ziziphus jujuba]
MAIASSPASQKMVSAKKMERSETNKRKQQDGDSANQPKRSKCPGVRVVGSRIYDSQNGKTCHQCRQKTRDFVASCKNLKKDRLCTINFCHKCLSNRYGENAEEMALLDDWNCPKCRGICNCSFCMKKRGHKPTGVLVHAAKATGFNSVSEMLLLKGPGNLNNLVVSPKKPDVSNKEPVVISPRKRGKENSFDGKIEANSTSPNSLPLSGHNKSKKVKRDGLKEVSGSNKDDGNFSINKSKKVKRDGLKDVSNGNKDDGNLSNNRSKKVKRDGLKEVNNGNKDGGTFSNQTTLGKPIVSEKTFKKEVETKRKDDCILSEKKRKKKRVLNDVSSGPAKPEEERKVNDGQQDPRVSNTLKEDNAKAKKKALKKCTLNLEDRKVDIDLPLPQGTILTTVVGIELPPEDVGHALQFLEFFATFGKVFDVKKGQAEAVLRELIRGRSGRGGQYSTIVRIHTQLLSLIQEDVREEKLRSWIDEQNATFVDRAKEAKEKVGAAKSKEKVIKQKLQDEVAKAIIENSGAPLSISEHEAVVSKIKIDAARAHAEILEAMGAVPKKSQRSDAVRTEPNLLDAEGRVFWKLKCFTSEPDILLQDMGSWDADGEVDKWFVYGSEQKESIEKYIRAKRSSQITSRTVPCRSMVQDV